MAEKHEHEHCGCGHEHHHTTPTSKVEQALSKYNCNISDEEVAAAVKKIITEKVPENDTLDVKKFLFGSTELTTLKPTDSAETFHTLQQYVYIHALLRWSAKRLR